jgi:hypothetical protein
VDGRTEDSTAKVLKQLKAEQSTKVTGLKASRQVGVDVNMITVTYTKGNGKKAKTMVFWHESYQTKIC